MHQTTFQMKNITSMHFSRYKKTKQCSFQDLTVLMGMNSFKAQCYFTIL